MSPFLVPKLSTSHLANLRLLSQPSVMLEATREKDVKKNRVKMFECEEPGTFNKREHPHVDQLTCYKINPRTILSNRRCIHGTFHRRTIQGFKFSVHAPVRIKQFYVSFGTVPHHTVVKRDKRIEFVIESSDIRKKKEENRTQMMIEKSMGLYDAAEMAKTDIDVCHMCKAGTTDETYQHKIKANKKCFILESDRPSAISALAYSKNFTFLRSPSKSENLTVARISSTGWNTFPLRTGSENGAAKEKGVLPDVRI